MGVNGPGGTKRMSHWRETGIWPSIYYSEAHLEQIFVHWRRLEEWAQFWKSPLPFISPSPCLFPPAALSRQGSTGTQWPCRRRGKKSGLIYFPLPAAAAAAEGDGGMWSRTMTNKQRSHDCKILRKFLQDEVKRTGCDTRTHKRVLAFSEKKKALQMCSEDIVQRKTETLWHTWKWQLSANEFSIFLPLPLVPSSQSPDIISMCAFSTVCGYKGSKEGKAILEKVESHFQVVRNSCSGSTISPENET